jgi:endonuclease YncB( thermonuclease family)
MQILRTLSVAAVAVLQLSAGNRTGPVLVTGAASATAIVVPGTGRVTLLGIRTPPTARTWTGGSIALDARERLNGLVAHRFVRLEYPHPIETGTVPRGAAYVFLEDGTFVNRVLVREGLARASGGRSGAHAAALQEAEADARAERRGMWARQSNSTTPQLPTTQGDNSQDKTP